MCTEFTCLPVRGLKVRQELSVMFFVLFCFLFCSSGCFLEFIILPSTFTPKCPKSPLGLSCMLTTQVPSASVRTWQGLCSTEFTLHISLLYVRETKPVSINGLILRVPSLFPVLSSKLSGACRNFEQGSKNFISTCKVEWARKIELLQAHSKIFYVRGIHSPDGKGSQGGELTDLI